MKLIELSEWEQTQLSLLVQTQIKINNDDAYTKWDVLLGKLRDYE